MKSISCTFLYLMAIMMNVIPCYGANIPNTIQQASSNDGQQAKHPFPTISDEEDLQLSIIDDSETRNNTHGSKIGDQFILYDDMYNFLDMIPHGTDQKVTHKTVQHYYDDIILSKKDDNFDADIKLMDEYYRAYHRILAPTMKDK